MNEREVISFALHITEERDLLAICGKTFTHSDVLACYVKWKGTQSLWEDGILASTAASWQTQLPNRTYPDQHFVGFLSSDSTEPLPPHPSFNMLESPLHELE